MKRTLALTAFALLLVSTVVVFAAGIPRGGGGGGGGSGDTHPIADSNTIVKGSADGTKTIRLEADGLTTSTTRVWTAPDQDLDFTPDSGDFAASGASAHPLTDTSAAIAGSADATKLLRFEVDGITTGTTRVITVPDANVDLTPVTGDFAAALSGLTDDTMIRANGTTGVQGSSITVDDSDNVGAVGTLTTTGLVTAGGGVDVEDAGVKPTCDATTRGYIHNDEGGAGVVDTFEVCTKDVSDVYAWRDTIASGGGDVVDDTTPQLGGDLDGNGKKFKDALGSLLLYDTIDIDADDDADLDWQISAVGTQGAMIDYAGGGGNSAFKLNSTDGTKVVWIDNFLQLSNAGVQLEAGQAGDTINLDAKGGVTVDSDGDGAVELTINTTGDLVGFTGAWDVKSGGTGWTLNGGSGVSTLFSPQSAATFVATNAGRVTMSPQVQNATGDQSGVIISPTVNKLTSGDAIAFEVDVVDTSSPDALYLMDLQVGGVSKFTVDETGSVNQAFYGEMTKEADAGSCTSQTIHATAGTFTDVAGFSAGALNGFTFATNQFTAAAGTSGTFLVNVGISFESDSGAAEYEVCVEVNGTVDAGCCFDRSVAATELGRGAVSCIVTVAATDTINAAITDNDATTQAASVCDAQVVITRL